MPDLGQKEASILLAGGQQLMLLRAGMPFNFRGCVCVDTCINRFLLHTIDHVLLWMAGL